MSTTLDNKFADVAKWFHYHKDTIDTVNLGMKVKFLEKTCENLLDILAIVTHDMEQLEGPRRRLFLPREMQVHGDVRKFG